ncbi:MAG: hypothetical protein V8R81_05265 [Clostridia bacterium]
MIENYRKSKKKFKEYIKKNPDCTKEEWDKYAQDNRLFSSTTLAFHKNAHNFEELKKKMKRF